jgi:hypothetical protein
MRSEFNWFELLILKSASNSLALGFDPGLFYYLYFFYTTIGKSPQAGFICIGIIANPANQ